MNLGFFMPSHGVGAILNGGWYLQTPPPDLDIVDVGRWAEAAGFHSVWFSDHVAMPYGQSSFHGTADPVGGRSCYSERPYMLDAAVTMGAVAAATTRIRLASSVLIAPYRHPLSDARQFMTVDRLSGGRLILGVGAGWLEEEFQVLGQSYPDRVAATEECIEIYKRSWTDDQVSYDGKHFRFPGVSMDPKPVQTPRPPVVFGGASPLTVRLAVRQCDGYYPTFVDVQAGPDRYIALHDVARREAEAIGRDPATFAMLSVVSARIQDKGTAGEPSLCVGPPGRVLDDLSRLAAAGYSLVVLHLDCPSGTASELHEQIDRFGREVLAEAHAIRALGPWGTNLLG